jgi:hypothetical protein
VFEPPYCQWIRESSYDDRVEEEQASSGESERIDTGGLYGCSDTVKPRAEIREDCCVE